MAGSDEPASTVAFDALGAEAGAEAVVEGVACAAADGIAVRVFGDPERARRPPGARPASRWSPPDDEIANDEEPVARFARKAGGLDRPRRRATSRRADSDALASPGSTGATMAAALFALRRMRGVQRPALAVQLADAGPRAPDAAARRRRQRRGRASHLVQFAYLGAAFGAAVLGVGAPRVALLSVGEERRRAAQLVVEAHAARSREAGGASTSAATSRAATCSTARPT